jgi:hypothetical protein
MRMTGGTCSEYSGSAAKARAIGGAICAEGWALEAGAPLLVALRWLRARGDPNPR